MPTITQVSMLYIYYERATVNNYDCFRQSEITSDWEDQEKINGVAGI